MDNYQKLHIPKKFVCNFNHTLGSMTVFLSYRVVILDDIGELTKFIATY